MSIGGGQTTLYPTVEFKENTYELDEFDCASIFVLVGAERALVIDAGMGIGDLKKAVTRITDKPVALVLTHGHIDHIQQSYRFGECYLNLLDRAMFKDDVDRRKSDARLIAAREKRLYAYDVNRDITPWTSVPVVRPLTEGMTFDLGGGRIVTAYATPGHTAGSMALLDSATRSLFAGDAVNNNLWISMTMNPDQQGYVGIPETLKGLQKLRALEAKYDGIYNGHHDYRALGTPLDKSVLPSAITLCEGLLSGDYTLKEQQNTLFPDKTDTVVRLGDTWLSIDKEQIPSAKRS